MCILFAVTPFAFSLTEPHERNYVNQTYPCKMLQQFGGCGQVGPVMKALQWLLENVFLRALISCDVFHCDFPLCCSTFLSIFSNHVLALYAPV